MAKIYLIGGITHDISNERAETIKKVWLDKSRNQDNIDLGEIAFKVSQIKSIVLESPSSMGFDYNDQIAKEFERELNGRTFDKYCLDMKFYKYDDPHVQVINYNTVQQYNEAKDKNKHYEELRSRRIYAKKQDSHSLDDIIATEELDQKISALF